jgi:hypothetical protein
MRPWRRGESRSRRARDKPGIPRTTGTAGRVIDAPNITTALAHAIVFGIQARLPIIPRDAAQSEVGHVTLASADGAPHRRRCQPSSEELGHCETLIW